MASNPRPFQTQFQAVIQARLAMLAQGNVMTVQERTVVAHVYPGSGKTLMSLLGANTAWQQGQIDAVVAFVPRLNLGDQIEQSWGLYCKDHSDDSLMGRVCQVANTSPLIRHRGQFGYISTYASLVADPNLHHQFFAKRAGRVLMILDEGHILGYDSESDDGTKAAREVLKLAEHSALTILMTGTAYRGDGQRLILARYSDPDQGGVSYLQADVTATYLDGVRGGYLRPFEAELFDAHIEYDAATTGNILTTTVQAMERGLGDLLRDMRFSTVLIDRAVEKVKELQAVWPRYCGLIAAVDQKHAKTIDGYLQRQHPQIRTLIAVSDDASAQSNLAQFRRGNYDILITVAMAHIGYDYRPISVVCCLSAIRDEGWLRQLFARAMRTMATGDADTDAAQRAYVIAPDDPQMQRIVEMIRSESEQGVVERNGQTADRETGNQRADADVLIINQIDEIDARAVGMDHGDDVSYGEFAALDEMRRRHKIGPVPITALKAFLREASEDTYSPANVSSPTPAIADPAFRSARETEAVLRSKIKRLADQADALLGAPSDRVPYGYTYTAIERHLGHKMGGEDDCRAILVWLTNTWMPQCRTYAAQQKGQRYA